MSKGFTIIDDNYMNDAVKDSSMLSTFTEGRHHKNIRVLFFMQNIISQRVSYSNDEYQYAVHGVVQESS